MRIAGDVRAVWAQSWVTPWVWPGLVTYNVVLGVLLVVGGTDRISSPSFTAVREVGHVTVGVVFVVAGLGMAGAALINRRALELVSMFAATAHLFLAAGFLVAVLSEPSDAVGVVRPALIGPPTYLVIAAWHFANAFLYGKRGPLGERGGSD